MIFTQAGSPVEAVITEAPIGILGSIEWALVDPSDGSFEIARSNTGITNPQADVYRVSFTAPATPDSYLVRWYDAAGTIVLASEDLIVTAGPPPTTVGTGVLPSVQEIGNLLRARTKTDTGAELGTFASNTRPTGAAVAELIVAAAQEVYACTGSDFSALSDVIRPGTELMVRRAISYRTVMDIELSYFPEQASSERSAFESYKALYEGRDGRSGILAKVCAAVKEAVEGSAPGFGDDGTGGLPSHTFPANGGGIVGWNTVY